MAKGGGKLFKAAIEAAGKNGRTLIRKAKGLIGKGADDAASASTRQVRRMTPDEAWKASREARDKLHEELRQKSNKELRDLHGSKKKRVTVVTGATDPESRITVAGHNRAAKSADGSGDWGCAERDALDKLNAERRAQGYTRDLRPDEVYYSEARELRSGDPSYVEKPICARYCQTNIPRGQFPPGTTPEPGGAWGTN